MGDGFEALRTGLRRVVEYKEVLAVLFAFNLASAVLLAAVPALNLLGPAHRPAIEEAADGLDAWLVIETLMKPLVQTALGPERGPSAATWQMERAVSVGLIVLAALPLLAWLSAAFLGGGALLIYVEAPQSFRWRRFLWGCWRWFGAFLLLGAVQGVATGVVFVPLVVAAIAAIVAVGGWLAWPVVPLLAGAGALWLMLFECTRVAAVAGGKRNVFRAFGDALRFLFRRFPSVAALYGAGLLLLALVHALYRWGVAPRMPLHWWLLVLVVQQLFVVTRLGARLSRLAGVAALYRQRQNLDFEA